MASSKDDEACMFAMKLLGGFSVPMTLKAVIELGLIDQLLAADGRSMTVEELAARLPCPSKTADMVDRMLRFLASHSVVNCTTELGPDGTACRSYAATPVCKWLAVKGMEESVVPFGRMILNKAFIESWYYMKDAVLDGGTPPFEKAHGLHMFEYLRANESLSMLFNQAMSSLSVIVTKKLVDIYSGFKDISVLVDVGGGNGTTLQIIKGQHKNLRCINYDLPHVVAQAAHIEGVEHVGGSMFDNIPQGNAVLLKNVLHDWGDKECIKILKNCYTALPVNGKVIVLECILPASPVSTLAAQGAFEFDLAMLISFASGKERTEQEITRLAMEAGFFGEYKATYIFCNVWALEFINSSAYLCSAVPGRNTLHSRNLAAGGILSEGFQGPISESIMLEPRV
ncbi:hypothetical protein EJB05_27890, partial [Eragrostis curvula]